MERSPNGGASSFLNSIYIIVGLRPDPAVLNGRRVCFRLPRSVGESVVSCPCSGSSEYVVDLGFGGGWIWRALPIRVITVGKKRAEGVRLLVDEYKAKLKPYCSFEDSLVRSNPRNAQDVRAQVEDEEVAVMKLIGPDDWVVVLDERGRDVDSEQMAELLGDAGNSGMDYSQGPKLPSLRVYMNLLFGFFYFRVLLSRETTLLNIASPPIVVSEIVY
ncbi:unnamed protein product [Brassica napus]|uniref:(rape) hypothetical protein n=1 Tax=Brassica napus TaxID=3708 RepID=A0A816JD11_BRANA|nr:unnamed protein product [Brassica napus]